VEGGIVVKEMFGVAALIVGLAVVAVTVSHGGETAKVVKSFSDLFTGSIRAATLQPA
jgi:hypothetical protein